MLPSLRRRRERQETIERLYGAIVAQARLPAFYVSLRVPDTLEGRFDLLVLHVYLVFRRLAQGDTGARAAGQRVFDTFIADMDGSLREMGAGDLAVPRRMRAMGEAFYGRAEAYDAALATSGEDAIAAALSRNVYGDRGTSDAARKLARYVRRATNELGSQDMAGIVNGVIHFPQPEE
jgi:cytochrome b pre-mRNA-processing protein 3